MKKQWFLLAISCILISPAIAGGLSNSTGLNPIKWRVGLQGIVNNSWILSPANFDLDGLSHNFTTTFGFGLMTEIGFTDRLGLELDVMINKYKQDFEVSSLNLSTSTELSTIDIPLLLRIGKHVYYEVGPQLSLINSAENSLAGDAKDLFQSTNIYGVMGLGGKFGIPTTNIGIRAGVRVGAGILDIQGVDAIGRNLQDSNVFIEELEFQRTAFWGIRLAVTYKITG